MAQTQHPTAVVHAYHSTLASCLQMILIRSAQCKVDQAHELVQLVCTAASVQCVSRINDHRYRYNCVLHLCAPCCWCCDMTQNHAQPRACACLATAAQHTPSTSAASRTLCLWSRMRFWCLTACSCLPWHQQKRTATALPHPGGRQEGVPQPGHP
jgi:hypothetical protein